MGHDDEQVDFDESEEITDDDRVVLVDEDGNEHDFLLLATLTIEDTEYAVLGPEEQVVDPDRDDVELTFFKVEIDDDGEEEFVSVDDEEEFEMVRAAVAELLGLIEDEGEDEGDAGPVIPEA